jgi:hypothetical protein
MKSIHLLIIKRVLILVLLIMILVLQNIYLLDKKLVRQNSRQLEAPILECNKEKWFSQDIIRGDYHNPESWGFWTKNGIFTLVYRTDVDRYTITFPYSSYSDKVDFELLSSTDSITFENNLDGKISLSFLSDGNIDTVKKLSFKTSKSVRPSSVSRNNSDSRLLGVELRSFEYKCP